METKDIENRGEVIKSLLSKYDTLDELMVGNDKIREHEDFFWALKKDILEACRIINGEPLF